MKTARLIRIDQSDEGTFGVFLTDGGWWYSMECPWRDNERGISCIPEGQYQCHFTMSNRFRKNLYILGHVHDRDGIRIHAANFGGDESKGLIGQLEGCIALGNRMGKTKPQKCLLDSEGAIKAFHNSWVVNRLS